MDENKITDKGARILIEFLSDKVKVKLKDNLIQNATKIGCLGDSISVEPVWNAHNRRRALGNKSDWSQYFFGPVQIIRSRIFDMKVSLTLLECPVCENVVLKCDMQQ